MFQVSLLLPHCLDLIFRVSRICWGIYNMWRVYMVFSSESVFGVEATSLACFARINHVISKEALHRLVRLIHTLHILRFIILLEIRVSEHFAIKTTAHLTIQLAPLLNLAPYCVWSGNTATFLKIFFSHEAQTVVKGLPRRLFRLFVCLSLFNLLYFFLYWVTWQPLLVHGGRNLRFLHQHSLLVLVGEVLDDGFAILLLVDPLPILLEDLV